MMRLDAMDSANPLLAFSRTKRILAESKDWIARASLVIDKRFSVRPFVLFVTMALCVAAWAIAAIAIAIS